MLKLFHFHIVAVVARATDFGSAKSVLLILLLAMLIGVAPACGAAITDGPPPDYGLTWKTVGAAGNRGTLPSEAPLLPAWRPSAGSVGYEFRLTQTEITRGQWLEFVKAYLPYHGFHFPDVAFTGAGFNPVTVGYAHPEYPATMSWEYAARYCNWLQNGKAARREAFEQGVYDTSTFTRNPDGSFNHVIQHTDSAKYWIPSLDEWIKGAYYDPNKYGDGQEGYWRYPGKSDVPLIPGLPSEGGQTNAGVSHGQPNALDVGSYLSVQSPWGLLDNSGGVVEWLGSGQQSDILGSLPYAKGSAAFSGSIDYSDQLEYASIGTPNEPGYGLRLASSVPSPGIALMPGALIFTFLPRRRHHEDEHQDALRERRGHCVFGRRSRRVFS